MADGISIVMLAGEAVPYAKVGGLADVIGALSPQLQQLGASVSILLPRYRHIDLRKFGFQPFSLAEQGFVPIGFESFPFDVHAGTLPNSSVRVFLIGNDHFFGRDGIYLDPATGNDYPDQADRWIFFQRAALEFIRTGLAPVDIVHCHDHQTALVSAYLRLLYRNHPSFAHTGSIFTIHNMGYQGLFAPETMSRTGFNIAEFYPGSAFEFFGRLNFMKAGLAYSNAVTTVSETYAREIRESSEFGYGLEGVLRARPDPPIGILNGIDCDLWNPELDPLIPSHFNTLTLEKKVESKRALLAAFGLHESRLNRPLLAMVSRLDVQKGFDLVVPVMNDLLKEDLSFVVLGSGSRNIEEQLRAIGERYSDRASIHLGYNDELAHLTEAGADIFLMPSRYEPCGLNQMYSMRYGTVPVVRATGGLADTVQEFDPSTGKGTGFSFRNYGSDELREAILRALSVWGEQMTWQKVMLNGMTSDFSWGRSAKRYIEVYEAVLKRNSA